jgi:pyruvate dehydrogenase E2 component (dihydrolipoamide acetyltransferase)
VRDATELRATPWARTLARTHEVDLAAVAGSGPRGRIGGDDVRTHVAARDADAAPEPLAASTAHVHVFPATDAPGRLVPFSPARRIAARRLAHSLQTAPHFYLAAHIDMGAVREALSAALRPIRKQSGAAPTMTVVLAHLVARTLRAHPLLNASAEGEATRLHDSVNIGVAMDRDGDLVVPVLRDAGTRSLAELTAEFRRLRDAVRSRTIPPADLRGATFTLSSLEMYGVDAYTAIIDPPQSAILAVGRTVDTPVGRDGQVVLRPMATLTLSSDHRVVDGVTAARFMADLRRAVAAPGALA